MKRVLNIVSSLDGGGVEHMLLNYYSYMDQSRITFDFIVHNSGKGMLEDAFLALNSSIYHVTPKHQSLRRNLLQTNDIIKSGNYDVVYCHQGFKGAPALFLAKRNNIVTRIAHGHIAFQTEKQLDKKRRQFLSFILKRYATHWFACGRDAGIWLYGRNAYQNGRVKVINNAIDTSKFAYNEDIRNRVRKRMKLEDKLVIGTVGRFVYQKNHEFLLRVFSIIYKSYRNAVLMLIGNGELEEEIRDQAKELGLTEAVLFLGNRSDVNELMQAMDLFVLPSRFEGLPVVLIEAQCAGLQCLASDTITREVSLTSNLRYVSIDQKEQEWADIILSQSNGYTRKDQSGKVSEAGFDIRTEAEKVEKLIEGL